MLVRGGRLARLEDPAKSKIVTQAKTPNLEKSDIAVIIDTAMRRQQTQNLLQMSQSWEEE